MSEDTNTSKPAPHSDGKPPPSSTPLSFEDEGQRSPKPGSPKTRLARSHRKQPTYDHVKDILCRFARAIEEEEYHEQHPSL